MKNIIVANWKMNPGSLASARVLSSRVDQGLIGLDKKMIEVVLCPPYVFLPMAKHAAHFANLGAQDVSAEPQEGPFTAQISAGQLIEFGVKFAIIGHSERRAEGETDEKIRRKIKICLDNSITPILCVGHGAKKGSKIGAVKRIVGRQLSAALKGLGQIGDKIVVAYEPVWAIGTNAAATPEHAREVMDFILDKVKNTRVIYGGSMTAHNAPDFAKIGMDGGLIGGASLDAAEFLQIARAFS